MKNYETVARKKRLRELKVLAVENTSCTPLTYAFIIYHNGLDHKRCRRIRDSSFFIAKRAWNRLTNDFLISERTKKRVLALAFDEDARKVFETVVNGALNASENKILG